MMADAPKRGRPAMLPTNRRAHNLTFRVRGDLRERLEAEAERNQRSVSEEVEARILDSFGPNEAMKTAILKMLDDRDSAIAATQMISMPNWKPVGPMHSAKVTALSWSALKVS